MVMVGANVCPICGVPFYQVHPHSDVCPSGVPIDDNVIHDTKNLRRQLSWKI